MANPSINLGNGNWSVKESKLLGSRPIKDKIAPIEFDVTRASTATRVNKQGLIETVNSNIARIDYSNDANGALLLENQSTNLVTYSESFDNAYWQKTGGGTGSVAVATSNTIISPDGTVNADTIVFNSGAGTTPSDQSNIGRTFSILNSTTYTFSVYLKGLTGGEEILFRGSDGVYDKAVLTNEWKIYNFTSLSTSTTATFAFGLRQGLSGIGTINSSASIYAWGAQLEQNSYATSYIPTSGTAQTRVEETCGGAGSSSSINSEEGVLYAEISALSDDLTRRIITLTDGTLNNILKLEYKNVSNQIEAVLYDGGTQCLMLYTLPDSIYFNKIAFKYKQNDFSLWVNGVKVVSDLSGGVFANNTLNNINFSQGGSNFLYGKIKDLRVYSTALTDSELQALTTL